MINRLALLPLIALSLIAAAPPQYLREQKNVVVGGRAEQWNGQQRRILGPGEMVLIQKGEVHGTYNPFRERLVFLAILSPANAPEPGIVDVSKEEPWASLRQKLGLPTCT